MVHYSEIPPPPHLTAALEYLWVMWHTEKSAISHRVLPDGCADILFTRDSSKPTLQAVGAMTRFEDFEIPPGGLLVGLRFRPGMWAAQLGVPADRITDQRPALEELWGIRARALNERIAETKSPTECALLLAGGLRNDRQPTPVQRALAWMGARRGLVSLDEVARQAGLSVRQFRRLCLQQSGLSPKLLARILRFRHALARLSTHAGSHADMAADCGYFDQSHFIAEFQRFSGKNPTTYFRR